MVRVLKVDSDKCIGCGTCVALCPKVFALNKDGKSEVIDQAGESEENIQSAIDACPVGAISWDGL